MTTARKDLLAQEELQKAKMLINLFINSCSHTMRGPLKSIEGVANLLIKEGNYLTDEGKTFLTHIQSSAVKLELTLDSLENILENSHQAVYQKPVYFRELLSTVFLPYQQKIEEAGIQLDYSIEESSVFYCDTRRLRIVLANMVANAIFFGDPAKAKQEIAISVRSNPSQCVIAITDNGEGIEAENHDKIFELFFRGSEKSTGAGIGLYIVRDMLTKMGGTISVDSMPGHGAVFTITIPNVPLSNN